MLTIPIAGLSEPFSSVSHLLGAGTGIAGAFLLVMKGRGNMRNQISLIIYSVCLVFLFSMSGVFHMLDRGTSAKYIFRILDYAAIFALIAGTFTPIHMILFRGVKRWLILVLVWGFAIAGLTLTSIFFNHIPQWVSYAFFLGLGWVGFFSYLFIRGHQKIFGVYIAVGGLFYTIGAIFDYLNWPNIIPGIFGHHELFHVLVLAGALAHWLLIYRIADFREG